MKKLMTLSASALLTLSAGQALAQVTVDGRIAGPEAGLYGSPRWVQNVPTGFGDNAPPPAAATRTTSVTAPPSPQASSTASPWPPSGAPPARSVWSRFSPTAGTRR